MDNKKKLTLKEKVILISVISTVLITAVVLIVVFTTMNRGEPAPSGSSGRTSSSVVPSTSQSSSGTGSTSASSSINDGLYEITLNDGVSTTKYRAAKIIVSDLPVIERDGYIFRGWELSTTPGIITADMDIDSDITLMAKFDIIKTIDSMAESKIDPASTNILNIDNITPYNYLYENTDGVVTLADNKYTIGENGKLIINIDTNIGIAEIVFSANITSTDGNVIELYTDNNKTVYTYVEKNKLVSNIESNDVTFDNTHTYNFYYRIDITNKLIDIAVDSKEYITGYKLDTLTNLDNITIMNSAISNIAVSNELKISRFVDYYSSKLDEYVEGIDLSLYDNNGEEIIGYRDNAKNDIALLDTVKDIEDKYDETITNIDNVKTTAEKEYEAAYNSALDSYKAYLNERTYLMLDEMKLDDTYTYKSKDDFIDKFTEELEDVTNITELNALITKYEGVGDRYSDTNNLMISEYKDFKRNLLMTEFKKDDYVTNKTDYDNVFLTFANNTVDTTKKTVIDNYYTEARNALLQIKSDTQLFEEMKADALAEMHQFIEEDMALAIANLKDTADNGDEGAETQYEALMAYVDNSYTAIAYAINERDVNSRVKSFKTTVRDYIARGLKQLDQVKDARRAMLEEYKAKILGVLEAGTELYNNINAVVIEDIDRLDITIDYVIEKYNEAISRIESLAYTSSKAAARVTLEEYVNTEYEKLAYYKYYSDPSINNLDKANIYRNTTLKNVLDNASYNIVKAADSEMDTVIANEKANIDTAIIEIRNNTEFEVSFILKDRNGNVMVPRSEFDIPDTLTQVLGQTLVFSYGDQFDRDTEGRPYVMIGSDRYIYAGVYVRYNGYSDREEYVFNTPISEDMTLYLVWNIEA